MDQKLRFVSLAATGRFTFAELCADFHISRKTGHKWWRVADEVMLYLLPRSPSRALRPEQFLHRSSHGPYSYEEKNRLYSAPPRQTRP